MAQYDTAEEIINAALVECGLSTVSGPVEQTNNVIAQQMTVLLTACGRELLGVYPWEQFVTDYTITEGDDPDADAVGIYDLPDDFASFIDQTGWNPVTTGMGLPLGGPLTEQWWTALVATNLASSTIYISFKIAQNKINVLPIPIPTGTTITFEYLSNGWVELGPDDDNAGAVSSKVQNSDDVIRFQPIMIQKMLVMRFKQARGLDATAAAEQFQAAFMSWTSKNKSAQILNLGFRRMFPYINVYQNLPQSGYGS